MEMSMRVFAMINAPAQVPDWFMPDTEMRSPKVRTYPDRQFGRGSGHQYGELYSTWYGDDGWLDENNEVPAEFKAEVEQWINERSKEMQAADDYEKKWKIDRYFLWRKFFADKVTGNDYVSKPGSPEEIESLESVIREQDQVIRQLTAWKNEVIENSPDYNVIGELMGLKIGQNVSTKIAAWMNDARGLLIDTVAAKSSEDVEVIDGRIRKFLNTGNDGQ
jgi:hypothetical protein